MADQDSLTPDQLDKVMEFQEVTGCTDVCVCVAALAGAEWQVEEAVHAHLTQASDQPSNDGSPSSPEVRRRTGVGVPEPPPLQHPPTEEPTVPQQRPLQVVGQWWGLLSLPLRGMTALLLRWPLRLCCWSLNSLLAVIYSLLYSTQFCIRAHLLRPNLFWPNLFKLPQFTTFL
ncbi:uncharacterized protein LOC125179078 [Hyalella azteca]|uniref:Uncharacterized protein LOC125179078 n=1 Tax=Hyalella azteca TaxID=294128 RepID=A0A979FV04_HYAAZ|nr:uncharacterized protein LOC125179078 [Hyalella azteca]